MDRAASFFKNATLLLFASAFIGLAGMPSPVSAVQVGLSNCSMTGSPARLVPRPKAYILACADGGIGIRNLVWHGWGEAVAYGAGDYFWNDCTPDCARGHFHSAKGTLIAYDLRPSAVPGFLFYNRIFLIGPPRKEGYSACADAAQC